MVSIGDLVRCKEDNYAYMVTDHKALCEVLQMKEPDELGHDIYVKVVEHTTKTYIGKEFWVDSSNFNVEVAKVPLVSICVEVAW